MAKKISELSDAELDQARRHLEKLTNDVKDIRRQCDGPGWDDVEGKIEEAWDTYSDEIARRGRDT